MSDGVVVVVGKPPGRADRRVPQGGLEADILADRELISGSASGAYETCTPGGMGPSPSLILGLKFANGLIGAWN
jgi:hypothetical protein